MDQNPYEPPKESGYPKKDWGRLAEYLADRLALIVTAIVVFVVLGIVGSLLFLPRLH